jgi:5-formyltetrahydrofolate cyclo-ligase
MKNSDEGMKTEKPVLRRTMLKRRRELSVEAWIQKSGAIRSYLQGMPEIAKAVRLHSYISIPREKEVSTIEMIEWFCLKRKQVAVPYIHNNGMSSVHYAIGDRLVPGIYGQPEPSVVRTVEEEQFDAVLVPLVAVDLSGVRLGYGSGYYDRFFARLNMKGFHPLKIGLAFELQVISRVPSDPWDERLDCVVTENGILQCQQT